MQSLLSLLKYDLNKNERKLVILSSLGGMFELYDFTIYGLFSVYFAGQFFPNANELISVISSFVVFVMGYIARPLGGIIAGHYGDLYGRKKIVVITLALMGTVSIGIGVLPTYGSIGTAAPIILLVFRLVQGLTMGGQLGSLIVFASESIPHKRGYAIGGALAGTGAGMLLGALVNLVLLSILTPEQMRAWGWRIPFIIGGFIVIISYLIREKLHEIIVELATKQEERVKIPFSYVLRHHWKEVIMGICVTTPMATIGMLTMIFMPTYLKQIMHIDMSVAKHPLWIAALLSVLASLLIGALANRYHPVKVTIKCFFMLLFIIPLGYYIISLSQTVGLLTLGLCLVTMINGFFVVLSCLLISYLFPQKVRVTGLSLAFNLGMVIFSGLTPIVLSYIILKTGQVVLTPIIYIWIAGAIGVIGSLWMKKFVDAGFFGPSNL